MGTLICQLKDYIKPFEKRLALKELETICNATPLPYEDHSAGLYRINTHIPLEKLVHSLAYWESVKTIDYDSRYTLQVKRESSLVQYNGSIPNRRCLRYGPHGIHEYRGKFFPQLVRALLNIGRIRAGMTILDPMCGSGTTLVEASLFGCESIGMDINPLSVFMSRTKCDLLFTDPKEILTHYDNILQMMHTISRNIEISWFESLPKKDRDYLHNWFAAEVLADLDILMNLILSMSNKQTRNLFLLKISNILRSVSWQKEADLRVRKEIKPPDQINTFAVFEKDLTKTVQNIVEFLVQNQPYQHTAGRFSVFEKDARLASVVLSNRINTIDAIITSPPYATALPYLDTDRLSLCYLGLLSYYQHRNKNYDMIGNRELTKKKREEYLIQFEEQRKSFPFEVVKLVNSIMKLNEANDVGFRRKNLPALLAKYFLDMREIFLQCNKLLKAGAPLFMVIGNNHTTSGDVKIEIPTAQLLGSIGETVGLKLVDSLSMDMLVSRDIFKQNAIKSESILHFAKTQ
jgi:site-specific DNA-methyltransferase (cytosine-N4-specific)